ncbi:terminase small subunit [Brevundimonas sp.]|uniref:terminase small subunit n=1 Tax=Brevundimonas sp. TaxID=1871086 RepID=UPI0025BF51EB|nr:terminase small subunit [Brevundimonas sp.]
MPALSNPKHERFAQALAKGKSQAEAYADAGYKPSEPNASRLTSNDKVQARLSELQERAATRTEITVASITERLLAIATKAEKSREAPMLQAARASLMDAAKLNGLVVDKSSIDARVTTPKTLNDFYGGESDA